MIIYTWIHIYMYVYIYCIYILYAYSQMHMTNFDIVGTPNKMISTLRQSCLWTHGIRRRDGVKCLEHVIWVGAKSAKVMWNALKLPLVLLHRDPTLKRVTCGSRNRKRELQFHTHSSDDLVGWFGDAEDMNMSTPPSIRVWWRVFFKDNGGRKKSLLQFLNSPRQRG